MRRLVMITASLLAICDILILGGRAIGHAKPAPRAEFIDPGPCSQPCWHGIKPGTTTLSEAIARLRADGVFSLDTHEQGLCWVPISDRDWSGCLSWKIGAGPDAPVTGLLLHLPFDTVTIAEVLPLFGEPLAAKRCWRTDTWQAYLIFPSNVALVTRNYSTFSGQPERFSPSLTIDQIWYYLPEDAPPYNTNMPLWRGFSGRRERPICRW